MIAMFHIINDDDVRGIVDSDISLPGTSPERLILGGVGPTSRLDFNVVRSVSYLSIMAR